MYTCIYIWRLQHYDLITQPNIFHRMLGQQPLTVEAEGCDLLSHLHVALVCPKVNWVSVVFCRSYSPTP